MRPCKVTQCQPNKRTPFIKPEDETIKLHYNKATTNSRLVRIGQLFFQLFVLWLVRELRSTGHRWVAQWRSSSITQVLKTLGLFKTTNSINSTV